MRHMITGVKNGSVAKRHGLRVNDVLLRINGESIVDEIDYQALSSRPSIVLTIERKGKQKDIEIVKDDWEPIGLEFGESMTLKPRACCNNCVFCFVDQLPTGMRSTLYVKDDDWRYSLMMGNYITLTNIKEDEFQRILNRHASPLYISVHATNPEIRKRMMNNRFAGNIMERLQRLKDGGIKFHCQIVCCPGWNDGDVLTQTLQDLYSLTPAVQSVSVVPVGLTKFRDNLTQLTLFNKESAKALLDQLLPFQAKCKNTLGTSFVFASDEFYCLSGEDIPPAEWYEDYPQIENGVGLLRQFEEQMREAFEDCSETSAPDKTYIIGTGVSAAKHMRMFCDRYAPKNVTTHVITIQNYFFGETITVTGLLTGEDILSQLPADLLDKADALMLSANMLRHERDKFLCDMTVEEFQERLPLPVRFHEDGYDFCRALYGK